MSSDITHNFFDISDSNESYSGTGWQKFGIKLWERKGSDYKERSVRRKFWSRINDPWSSRLEPSVIYDAYRMHYSDNHDIQVTASISRKLTFSRSQVRGSKSKNEDMNFGLKLTICNWVPNLEYPISLNARAKIRWAELFQFS